MTYREAIDYLSGIRIFGQMLGLETIQRLAHLLGEPQRSLKFLHIAGTNGKGSVAAMCQAVLTAAGYRTALYTSPHLVSFCERFQIDGQPIPEPELARLVARLQPLLAQVATEAGSRPATFFEVATAIALAYFHEQQADLVVWETGLGGRFDATNVVTPLVSVITNIDFDHTQYLGNTIAQIAGEKAGIIKPGVPVVTAATKDEALAVIRRVSAANGSPLTVVGATVRGQRDGETRQAQRLRLTGTRQYDGLVEIPLLGAHQVVNCATAVAALEAANLAVTPAQLRDGLRRTNWPGRFQILRERPTVVVDGGHNPAGVNLLAAGLREHFAGQPRLLILGILRDKDYERMCATLAPLARRIWCVPVNSDRTSDPQILAARCRAAHPQAAVAVAGSFREAFALAHPRADEVVVIAGSLFLAGEALREFQPPFGLRAAHQGELRLQ